MSVLVLIFLLGSAATASSPAHDKPGGVIENRLPSPDKNGIDRVTVVYEEEKIKEINWFYGEAW